MLSYEEEQNGHFWSKADVQAGINQFIAQPLKAKNPTGDKTPAMS